MNYKDLLGLSSASMNEKMNDNESVDELKQFHNDVSMNHEDISLRIAQAQGAIMDVKDAVGNMDTNSENSMQEVLTKLDVLSEGLDRVVEAVGSGGSGGSDSNSDPVTLTEFQKLSQYVLNNRIRDCTTYISTVEKDTFEYGKIVDCSRVECGRIIKLTNTHPTNSIKIINSRVPNTFYMLEPGEVIENINLGVQQTLTYQSEGKEISYKVIYEIYRAY